MNTFLIVIVVIAALLLVALAVMAPRMKQAKEERELQSQRDQAAEQHRGQAETRRGHAEQAELEAKRARAEADALEGRAQQHERGMADEELAGGERGGHDAGRHAATESHGDAQYAQDGRAPTEPRAGEGTPDAPPPRR